MIYTPSSRPPGLLRPSLPPTGAATEASKPTGLPQSVALCTASTCEHLPKQNRTTTCSRVGQEVQCRRCIYPNPRCDFRWGSWRRNALVRRRSVPRLRNYQPREGFEHLAITEKRPRDKTGCSTAECSEADESGTCLGVGGRCDVRNHGKRPVFRRSSLPRKRVRRSFFRVISFETTTTILFVHLEYLPQWIWKNIVAYS